MDIFSPFSSFNYSYERIIISILPLLIIIFTLIIGSLLIITLISKKNKYYKFKFSLLLISILLIIRHLSFLKINSFFGVFIYSVIIILVLTYLIRINSFTEKVKKNKQRVIISGLIIILSSAILKLIYLESWPKFINHYAAITANDGLLTLEGNWPLNFFQGKSLDLQSGGNSPLMLPILYVVFKIFGGNVFSARLAEVIGSVIYLIFFYFWLKQVVSKNWSLIILSVFAFSPWHIAQSRMGTFYSISAAVAVAILFFSQRISDSQSNLYFHWLALGFFTGLLGYSYSPVKVLYVFSLFIFLINTIRKYNKKLRKWYICPLLAILGFLIVFLLQIYNLDDIGSLFRSSFTSLATDNPILYKLDIDKGLSAEIQPLNIVINNFIKNLKYFIEWSFHHNSDLIIWYPFALSISIIYAVVALFRFNSRFSFKNSWLFGLYFLTGLLPPLITFPVPRRSIIIHPLVYFIAILFLKEVYYSISQLINKNYWMKFNKIMFSICLFFITFHGLYIYTKRNSIIGYDSYFGHTQTLELVNKAIELLPKYHIYFVNSWIHTDVFKLHIYEEAKKISRPNSYEFIHIAKNQENLEAYYKERPACFFYFTRVPDEDITETLKRNFPNGNLTEEYFNGRIDTPFYSFICSQD